MKSQRPCKYYIKDFTEEDLHLPSKINKPSYNTQKTLKKCNQIPYRKINQPLATFSYDESKFSLNDC